MVQPLPVWGLTRVRATPFEQPQGYFVPKVALQGLPLLSLAPPSPPTLLLLP